MRFHTDALSAGAKNIILKIADPTLNLCLGCSACTNTSQVRSQSCSNGSSGQFFDITSDHRTKSRATSNICLTALNSTYNNDIVQLIAAPCNTNDMRQVFKWGTDSNGGGRTLSVPALGNQYGGASTDDSCFAANGIQCNDQIKAAAQGMPSLLMPWCDSRKDATVRASALVAQMTMREKRSNLGMGGSMNPGTSHLSVISLLSPISPSTFIITLGESSATRGLWFGEALHGLEEGCGGGILIPRVRWWELHWVPYVLPSRHGAWSDLQPLAVGVHRQCYRHGGTGYVEPAEGS